MGSGKAWSQIFVLFLNTFEHRAGRGTLNKYHYKCCSNILKLQSTFTNSASLVFYLWSRIWIHMEDSFLRRVALFTLPYATIGQQIATFCLFHLPKCQSGYRLVYQTQRNSTQVPRRLSCESDSKSCSVRILSHENVLKQHVKMSVKIWPPEDRGWSLVTTR